MTKWVPHTNQEKRVRQRIKEEQASWDKLSKRIEAIKRDLALELDGQRTVVLQERLHELESRRDEVEKEIKRLEKELRIVSAYEGKKSVPRTPREVSPAHPSSKELVEPAQASTTRTKKQPRHQALNAALYLGAVLLVVLLVALGVGLWPFRPPPSSPTPLMDTPKPATTRTPSPETAVKTMPTAAASPTATETPMAVQPTPLLVTEPTQWPTPTPLVPLPLPVSLDDDDCKDVHARMKEDIEQGGGILVEAKDAIMHIKVQCDGSSTAITIQFPQNPAYRIEFLDEPAEISVSTDQMAYGHTFIQAAVAYARGNYGASEKLFREINVRGRLEDANGHFLHAQALMHLADWDNARTAYGAALKDWAEIEEEQQARAYGGQGLSYILQVQEQSYRDPETREACIQYAQARFGDAISMQPVRALWWSGRALAKWYCSKKLDVNAILADIEEAIQLSAGDGSLDEALALSMRASASIYLEEDPDISSAMEWTQQASHIAPELPLPFKVLSCSYLLREESKHAHDFYLEYLSRLVFPWMRERGLKSLKARDYCQ